MKPKIGDTVRLKPMVVKELSEEGYGKMEGVLLGGYFTSLWVPLGAIASIDPRPLQVGDEVTTKGGASRGELKAICGQYGWVNWSYNNGPSTVLLADITGIGVED